jgi:hypothetical protein
MIHTPRKRYFQQALRALHVDRNSIGVDFSVAHQRILNLLLEFRWIGAGLDGNQVTYSLNP